MVTEGPGQLPGGPSSLCPGTSNHKNKDFLVSSELGQWEKNGVWSPVEEGGGGCLKNITMLGKICNSGTNPHTAQGMPYSCWRYKQKIKKIWPLLPLKSVSWCSAAEVVTPAFILTLNSLQKHSLWKGGGFFFLFFFFLLFSFFLAVPAEI